MAYITKFNGNTDSTVTLGKEGAPTSVEGYFLGTKETPDTGFGPGKLHVFKTSEGDIGVWGKSRLNNMLTPELVGQMVLVEFTGMIPPAKKGRRPSYGFKVQHDPENTIEVSSVALTAPTDADDYEDSDAADDYLDAQTASVSPVRPSRPSAPLKTPSAADRAKVNALLSGRKVG